MNFIPTHPPRVYPTGLNDKLYISDCGRMDLAPDEQITLTTSDGGEYDITRKDWGFYATPSTNGRLASFGLRTLLACNEQGRCFVLLVEKGKENALHEYLTKENMCVLCWLDHSEAVSTLRVALEQASDALSTPAPAHL